MVYFQKHQFYEAKVNLCEENVLLIAARTKPTQPHEYYGLEYKVHFIWKPREL